VGIVGYKNQKHDCRASFTRSRHLSGEYEKFNALLVLSSYTRRLCKCERSLRIKRMGRRVQLAARRWFRFRHRSNIISVFHYFILSCAAARSTLQFNYTLLVSACARTHPRAVHLRHAFCIRIYGLDGSSPGVVRRVHVGAPRVYLYALCAEICTEVLRRRSGRRTKCARTP
jgi:hypothetical protein